MRSAISFKKGTLVLDEADQLLEYHFREDLGHLLKHRNEMRIRSHYMGTRLLQHCVSALGS